jgi:hypothetical protein
VKLNNPIAGIFDMIFQGLWILVCVDTAAMTELAKIEKIEKKMSVPAILLNPGLDVTASQSCLETT